MGKPTRPKINDEFDKRIKQLFARQEVLDALDTFREPGSPTNIYVDIPDIGKLRFVRTGDIVSCYTVIGQGGFGVAGEELCSISLPDNDCLIKGDVIKLMTTNDPIAMSSGLGPNEFEVGKKMGVMSSQYDLSSNTVAIRMRKFPGGDLEKHMEENSIAPASLIDYMEQMTNQVQMIHNLGYVHRDIKPENFFIDEDGNLALNDYGLAEKFNGNITKGFQSIESSGTYKYQHPSLQEGLALPGDTYSYNETTECYALLVSFEKMIEAAENKNSFPQEMAAMKEQIADLKTKSKITMKDMKKMLASAKKNLSNTAKQEMMWQKDPNSVKPPSPEQLEQWLPRVPINIDYGNVRKAAIFNDATLINQELTNIRSYLSEMAAQTSAQTPDVAEKLIGARMRHVTNNVIFTLLKQGAKTSDKAYERCMVLAEEIADEFNKQNPKAEPIKDPRLPQVKINEIKAEVRLNASKMELQHHLSARSEEIGSECMTAIANHLAITNDPERMLRDIKANMPEFNAQAISQTALNDEDDDFEQTWDITDMMLATNLLLHLNIEPDDELYENLNYLSAKLCDIRDDSRSGKVDNDLIKEAADVFTDCMTAIKDRSPDIFKRHPCPELAFEAILACGKFRYAKDEIYLPDLVYDFEDDMRSELKNMQERVNEEHDVPLTNEKDKGADMDSDSEVPAARVRRS